MKQHEAAYLASFLAELSSRFGNDGCNDMELPDTPENQEMVIAAENYCMEHDPDRKATVYGGKILTNNSMVLSYLKHLLMQEYGLDKKTLPKTG